MISLKSDQYNPSNTNNIKWRHVDLQNKPLISHYSDTNTWLSPENFITDPEYYAFSKCYGTTVHLTSNDHPSIGGAYI